MAQTHQDQEYQVYNYLPTVPIHVRRQLVYISLSALTQNRSMLATVSTAGHIVHLLLSSSLLRPSYTNHTTSLAPSYTHITYHLPLPLP